ncbi:hypothetical protein [Allocoleopsis franciscana]|uniref:Glycosyltransferase RgtA/B/C/D-like domain-containing protein n=1 Tax=Allocoleopsis franciscana PCC 7113 TaxID=1173027 RepID=K9W921_9CYAN|nr:hypothetical protein [Allocoleopsis franciscana]AFZ16895.1 hypothetical protein Mic7113_1000 [Allocoleopsis franciscana PCC 7113]
MHILANLNHSNLYLFVLVTFVYFIISILNYRLFKNKLSLPNSKISLIAACLLIVNYIVLLVLYATHNNFFDHAEANIATVSWLFQRGKPIYHELESAERYSIPYGPMLYVINGFFLNLLKPSLFSAKIGGILAGGLSLLLLFYALKKIVGLQIAIFCSGYISLIFISIYSYFAAATFWNRSDSFLIMFVALGLLTAVRTTSWLAILGSALSIGISVNLKIHGILYFLPIYILFYFRHGIYSVLFSILGSLILVIIPFIGFPQVSLTNYIIWLNEFGEQGLSLNLLKGNIIWSLYLLAPLLFLFIYFKFINNNEFNVFLKNNKYFIFSILVSLLGVAILGSKQGAGMNHLLPLIPPWAYLFALTLSQAIAVERKRSFKDINKYSYCLYISLIGALLTVTLIRASVNEIRFIDLSSKYHDEPVQEINEILQSYSGITIGMGYGGDYDLTYYRPILTYHGNPYFIDAVSMMDSEFLRKGIPTETLKALSSCKIDLWLIPKGGLPFNLYNYFNQRQVFSEEFKSTFLLNYELRHHTKHYNLWFCKK